MMKMSCLEELQVKRMQIKFDHVSFKYNKKDKYALSDINLEFNKNELVFIMGHTGSGKSTLAQQMNALLVPSEGNVSININDNNFTISSITKEKKLNELRKEIGLVFQFSEYQLFETTVLKDVMFGPINFFKDENKAKEMAIKALSMVGIDSTYYERSPFELSGGEKRKVAVAGVLASNPSVLILDEPTSSLDPVATKEMMNLLKKIKEEGKLVIVISHDSDLCYEYADRVIIMNDGKVISDADVFNSFKNIEVLKEASLLEPFVCKVKRIMNINDNNIRVIRDIKEVIKSE